MRAYRHCKAWHQMKRKMAWVKFSYGLLLLYYLLQCAPATLYYYILIMLSFRAREATLPFSARREPLSETRKIERQYNRRVYDSTSGRDARKTRPVWCTIQVRMYDTLLAVISITARDNSQGPLRPNYLCVSVF